MKGKLIKKENHYYFWSSDCNPEKNKGFVANSEGTVERKLSIKNCEAIANGYDLDELVSQKYLIENTGAMFMPNPHEVNNIYRQEGFKEGFQKALEILGDKKFSEEDMGRIMVYGYDKSTENEYLSRIPFDEYIRSLQQTQWDVEIVTKPYIEVSEGFNLESKREPTLDADSCLILKRI